MSDTRTPDPVGAVVLHAVSVDYGNRRALDEVSLTVPTGSITALLGPSGCGKTTLLRAVAGLEPVAAGTIDIAGRTVSSAGRRTPPERRGVGLVPQDGALFPHLTVRRNIGFGLRGRAGRAARVDELLDLAGLREYADRRPAQLSGGQRQRVALARALAPSPAVIGLDEPFSALDAGLRVRLRSDVKALLRLSGSTALLVTHDPAEAMSMADQVVVMLDGRIRQTGSPMEVYRRPVAAEVGELFGELSRFAVDDGDPGRLVRPHELRLVGDDVPAAAGRVPGIVDAVDFRGGHCMVTVLTEQGERLLVTVPVDDAPAIGDRATVALSEPAVDAAP